MPSNILEGLLALVVEGISVFIVHKAEMKSEVIQGPWRITALFIGSANRYQ